MKNADMPAMPVLNGDNEPAEFDHSFYRNGNLAVGLTKREMMAMAAMQGLLVGGGDIAGARYRMTELASEAVGVADSILAELEKQHDQ